MTTNTTWSAATTPPAAPQFDYRRRSSSTGSDTASKRPTFTSHLISSDVHSSTRSLCTWLFTCFMSAWRDSSPKYPCAADEYHRRLNRQGDRTSSSPYRGGGQRSKKDGQIPILKTTVRRIWQLVFFVRSLAVRLTRSYIHVYAVLNYCYFWANKMIDWLTDWNTANDIEVTRHITVIYTLIETTKLWWPKHQRS